MPDADRSMTCGKPRIVILIVYGRIVHRHETRKTFLLEWYFLLDEDDAHENAGFRKNGNLSAIW